MDCKPVLIAGEWRKSSGTSSFSALNPRTREPIPEHYPVSDWSEIEAAIHAAADAFVALRKILPSQRANFLEDFADRLGKAKDELVHLAHAETALPAEPRLASVEMPRTINQLRLAAGASRDPSWAMLTIDSANNLRSMLAPIGPVCVFGPNNFPFAFNGIAGGDFAAALAAGNPVIAKANPGHPGTTRRLAELAHEAAVATEMPAGTIQLLYQMDYADGERLVSHPLIGATAFTGAKRAGLVLKKAADEVGKPIYLELSSVNPVVILPGVLYERAEQMAEEFATSCLMGAGQFCTNPGLVLMVASPRTEQFIEAVTKRFADAPVSTLLGTAVEKGLAQSVEAITKSGANLLTGGKVGGGAGCSYANTLMRTTGKHFLAHAEAMQREAFGNAALVVVADSIDEIASIIATLEGNLTGCIYSHKLGEDDNEYDQIAPLLRQKVGRLLNDKMPTGVAVSNAMNHGGPFPSTGHPGFTAVGIPASLRRFTMLQCYDAVREHRLPPELRDENLVSTPWRLIDGNWTRADVD